jgi:stress response protein SCP2
MYPAQDGRRGKNFDTSLEGCPDPEAVVVLLEAFPAVVEALAIQVTHNSPTTSCSVESATDKTSSAKTAKVSARRKISDKETWHERFVLD